MSKAFASSDDLGDRKSAFDQIGPGLYAYTAEGDPNSGVIIGDDCCMVVDAQPSSSAAIAGVGCASPGSPTSRSATCC